MRRDRQTGIERRGLALIEEALHLVRTAPPACLLAYYIGSVPFAMSLLYFWAHMSYSADAYLYSAPGALFVALMFVWMKAWQAVYARHLLAHVRDEPSPQWTFHRVMQLTASQAFIHAVGFLALIPALILVLPFLYVYGFLQNATILGGDGRPGLAALGARAWEHAKLWPQQSVFVIWLLSPVLVVLGLLLYLVVMPVLTATVPEAGSLLYGLLFRLALLVLCPLGFAVTLNLEVLLALIPELGRIFLGIQSMPLRAGLVFDSTLTSAAVGAMAYLLMDPLVKAAFVLRIFYSESRSTGADLRMALRRIARLAGLVLLAGCAALSVGNAVHAQQDTAAEAQETAGLSIDTQELDRAISETLEQEIYRWRQPRVRPEPRREDGPFASIRGALRAFLERAGNALLAVVAAIMRFIRWILPSRAPIVRGWPGWLGGARILLTVLMVALLAALVFLLISLVLRRRRAQEEEEAEAVASEVDIEDENVSPEALPESGWLAMARELLEKNEPRLALRALFLAELALLGRTHFVRIAKGKSNREYQRELARRAHAAPGLLEIFSDGVRVFESVWYGTRHVTPPDVRQFAETQERLRRYVEPE